MSQVERILDKARKITEAREQRKREESSEFIEGLDKLLKTIDINEYSVISHKGENATISIEGVLIKVVKTYSSLYTAEFVNKPKNRNDYELLFMDESAFIVELANQIEKQGKNRK